MKKTLPVLLCLALALLLGSAVSAAVAVGDPAPDFRLKDLDGKEVALSSLRGKIVVIEWMNPNCPFIVRHAKEGTMTGIVQKHTEIVFLAVNSTSPAQKDYLGPAAHAAFNREHGIGYPVLYDPTGEVGKAYGAKTTPHMFVIDAAGIVRYNGAIDDAPSGGAKVNYVEQALAALATGRPVEPATTKPYGCTVKY
ncbi:MAG: thioredoxin family protein [Thermoanaerobaculia bacterium]|nr:thioredoxin family protein [Thermoanaerobaculia bacterium]